MTTSIAFDLKPASPHIGADIINVDLAALIERDDLEAREALRLLLDRYIILRFRGQTLTPGQIERFGLGFGPLMSLKRKERPAKHIEGIEYLKIISNAKHADGAPVGDGSTAPQDWHSDGAAKPKPATYSYFYARQVPAEPPKTYWMNMYLVYESLPQALKDEIADLDVIHHEYPAGNEFPLPPSYPLEKRLAGSHHPLVRVHPATGRPILYLPHRDDMLVAGMSPQESARLVTKLRAFAAQSPYWWGAAMEVDDFVVWDNRASLHRRDGWDASLDRVMWHLANEGEEPIRFTPRRAAASG